MSMPSEHLSKLTKRFSLYQLAAARLAFLTHRDSGTLHANYSAANSWTDLCSPLPGKASFSFSWAMLFRSRP